MFLKSAIEHLSGKQKANRDEPLRKEIARLKKEGFESYIDLPMLMPLVVSSFMAGVETTITKQIASLVFDKMDIDSKTLKKVYKLYLKKPYFYESEKYLIRTIGEYMAKNYAFFYIEKRRGENVSEFESTYVFLTEKNPPKIMKDVFIPMILNYKKYVLQRDDLLNRYTCRSYKTFKRDEIADILGDLVEEQVAECDHPHVKTKTCKLYSQADIAEDIIGYFPVANLYFDTKKEYIPMTNDNLFVLLESGKVCRVKDIKINA